MPVPTLFANLAQAVGEDKLYQDTIFQSDGTTPQNITSWSVSFTVHAYNDPTLVYFQKTIINGTVQDGIAFPDPTHGVMNITVANADTVNMPPGEYEYIIERTDTGNDAVLTRGLFTLLRK